MKKYLLASLLMTLAPTVWANPPKPAAVQARRTIDFKNADLVYVIKTLARMMRRHVYIGPGVQGSVTIHLTNVTPEEALAAILKKQKKPVAFKLVGSKSLIVAASERVSRIDEELLHPTSGTIRQEILLEGVPAAKVIHFLQTQYPGVQFIPHPGANGFFAVGSREDILGIKSDVPNLDRVPDCPPPPQREFARLSLDRNFWTLPSPSPTKLTPPAGRAGAIRQ